jgi:hypothetical protein
MSRRLLSLPAGILASLLIASTALGFECTNASKSRPAAGAQVVFAVDGTPLYVTNGLLNRIDKGLVDEETGEGYHGQVAFDFDGDGVADASVYFGVGPDGEIPLNAQLKGPACRGLTNIGIYLEQCIGS